MHGTLDQTSNSVQAVHNFRFVHNFIICMTLQYNGNVFLFYSYSSKYMQVKDRFSQRNQIILIANTYTSETSNSNTFLPK